MRAIERGSRLLLLLCWFVNGTSVSSAQEGWQWENPTPLGSDIFSVQALTNTTVVAVGTYGNALKSTDGGQTWSVRYTGTPVSLYALWYVNLSTGFAVGDFGTIVSTTDGGDAVNLCRVWHVGQDPRTREPMTSVA